MTETLPNRAQPDHSGTDRSGETLREAARRERMIRELEAQHSAYERTLAEELRRPVPDAVLVRRLKRAKLALRDRAALLARGQAPQGAAAH